VDEAGRGCLAGPLVVAGVLFDYEALRDHRVRPLAGLNDSKQLSGAERESLFRAVVGSARSFTVRVISPSEIDRSGLHSSNLEAMRSCLRTLAPPAEAWLSPRPGRARASRSRRRGRAECGDRCGLDRREGGA
jgi:ribonuclease HII